jgi:CubicO group peptidase (beta-lactamase class C family)
MNPREVILQHLETHDIPAVAWAFGQIDSLEMGCTGQLWHKQDAPATTLETVFDLASLTKVLVTVPLLLKLIGTGKLDPNAPLLEVLPEIKGFPLGTATILQLVSHTAGLEALSPLRTWKLSRAAALLKALEVPRVKSSLVYSDQGFLVLTYILEKIYEARLDLVATRELFAPNVVNLTYQPNPSLCAATEIDKTGELIIGRVHDENTAALKGVSGHAGLFGNLLEVCKYLNALIRGQILSQELLRLMQQEVARESHDARAFGWLIPHENWLGGQNAPPDTLGHTGFTGTGIWFSLQTQECHVLLSNRVCPSRETPNDIAGLRRTFNQAAWLLS